jgi:hypothetical protein
MILRAREAVVAEFLRKALAVEPLAVLKLDAMEAMGLLGERQRITNAKVFRRAKVLLGIRSIRDGFGPGGRWAWKLPPSSDVPANSSARHEPSIPREPVVPREWVQGVARLEHDRPPADVPRHRWHQFLEDCRAFLGSEALVHCAAHLGWDATALFGCCRNPLMYLGKAGLLWQVSGGRIIELHRDWAVIDRPVNRSPHTFSRRNVDPEKITLPWHLRPRNEFRDEPRCS